MLHCHSLSDTAILNHDAQSYHFNKCHSGSNCVQCVCVRFALGGFGVHSKQNPAPPLPQCGIHSKRSIICAWIMLQALTGLTKRNELLFNGFLCVFFLQEVRLPSSRRSVLKECSERVYNWVILEHKELRGISLCPRHWTIEKFALIEYSGGW